LKKLAEFSFIKQTLTREYLSSREKACWKENRKKFLRTAAEKAVNGNLFEPLIVKLHFIYPLFKLDPLENIYQKGTERCG